MVSDGGPRTDLLTLEGKSWVACAGHDTKRLCRGHDTNSYAVAARDSLFFTASSIVPTM
jgi:hypothetical protein